MKRRPSISVGVGCALCKQSRWLLTVILLGFAVVAYPQFVVAVQAPRPPAPPGVPAQNRSSSSGTPLLYLPLISSPSQHPPVLFGVYSTVYIADQSAVDQYLIGLDSWAGLNRTNGTGHSIWGDFISLEVANPNVNVYSILETPWSSGYTTFVNLSTSLTSAGIASGADDAAIRAWAQAYASWLALGGNRRAFIAPLQEMNGYWTSYGLDPTNFKQAYAHIQDIFAAQGVTRSQVWWTFAPNGYTRPGDPPIQAYYPGDDQVDVIAFSAYNFGTCSANPWPLWQTPDQVYGPYISIIRQQVSASKPIFIAETGTTSAGGSKDQWLRDAYAYLVQQDIRGILYFNSDKECDWAVYQPWLGGRQVQGYKDAVSYPNLRYIAPADLSVYPLPP